MSSVGTNLRECVDRIRDLVEVADELNMLHVLNMDELEAEFLAALDEVREYYRPDPEPVDDEFIFYPETDTSFLEAEEEFEVVHDDEDA